MLDFLLCAEAIKNIYAIMKDDFKDGDFHELDEEYRKELKGSSTEKYYTINPNKLNKEYAQAKEVYVITEEEKRAMLKGRDLIYKMTEGLKEDVNFKERLLYAKSLLPPAIT
jgi:hypothetical protein